MELLKYGMHLQILPGKEAKPGLANNFVFTELLPLEICLIGMKLFQKNFKEFTSHFNIP